jgi:hypothetical protein
MPSRPKTTLFEECRNRDCMPPPDKSITKDVESRRKKRRAHEAWLAKVGEQLVENLEVPSAQVPSAQVPSAELKHKKTKRRRRKRRNPTKKKKKKKPTKKR